MVLTEEKLKALYKTENFKELNIEKGTILTPSARQFLTEKGINLISGKKTEVKKVVEDVKVEIKEPKYKGLKGEFYFEKPENMTQLYGTTLVSKNHLRIKLRGDLDLLHGKWILFSKEVDTKKNLKLSADLKSIEEFIKKILISEILETPLENLTIFNENLDKIKEISHNPKKYFDLNHLFNITSDYDLLILKLNELRGFSRTVEIIAVETFYKENEEIKRLDLLTALNRLSSAIYIMMLKGVKGEYRTR